MSLLFFDAHLHIIDPRFPISKNQGFLPDPYTVDDYRHALADLETLVTPVGGAIVSGSFQGFDQSYLLDALEILNAVEVQEARGSQYVGVTQIPYDYPDTGIMSLHRQGVRAVRFNLRRGGSESADHIEVLSRRVYDLAGWHVEFYIDAAELDDALIERLLALPQIVVDHLGLSEAGLPPLLRLVEGGARVKASGFHRGDLNWLAAMRQIHAVNPDALMFGTDLPGTRAPMPFQRADLERVLDAFAEDVLQRILYENARALYRLG